MIGKLKFVKQETMNDIITFFDEEYEDMEFSIEKMVRKTLMVQHQEATENSLSKEKISGTSIRGETYILSNPEIHL